MLLLGLIFVLVAVVGSQSRQNFVTEYFNWKKVRFVSVFHCNKYDYISTALNMINTNNIRVKSLIINEYTTSSVLEKVLKHNSTAIGVLLYSDCPFYFNILEMASKLNVFDSKHSWLILNLQLNTTNELKFTNIMKNSFGNLNLSINTDIAVGFVNGLNIFLREFKYYNRWNFHNLTLRAISVVLGKNKKNSQSDFLDIGYTEGISAMTKLTSIVLYTLKEIHNFRFNYTITDRWVGSPVKNSSLAVTNSMHWKQQDISSTCLRIFSPWLDWMDPFFPPITFLETKFYYRILNTGVGDYENRFVQPLSPTVWWCCVTSCAACCVVLAFGAYFENRTSPFSFAFFSITAAACQQDFDEGDQPGKTLSTQGNRIVLFVIGFSSMLLYNYYTSSVVSWLLNAAPSSIDNIDGLIKSNLELIFEDIGYTRSWLEGPGFYYYSGSPWSKEDELRETKVKKAERTVKLLQAADDGIALVRKGGYAYHTEPYNANLWMGQTCDQDVLCELGALQMMKPAPVYIMGQKNSPYKQFFVWSMLRASERGHISYARRRISIVAPRCFGRVPRALSLGQAAPAFAVLSYGYMVSIFILLLEIIFYRYYDRLSQNNFIV